MQGVDPALVRGGALKHLGMTTRCIPPYEEWPALLAANREIVQTLHKRVGESIVRDVRAQVVKAALQYSSSLRELARKAGIPLPAEPRESADVSLPIIMAGHQPVIYHSGILEKMACLRKLAKSTGAMAINVAIDTDEGDAGRIAWPHIKGDELSIKLGTIGTQSVLFRSQRVGDVSQVARICEEAQRDLSASGLPNVATRVARVSRLYQALAHESIVAANAIVRWAESGTGYLELPLSQMVELSAVRMFIQAIVENGKGFVATYNATLDEYRRSHKIKNPANPFPNMTMEPGLIELPLWCVAGDARLPLKVVAGEPAVMKEEIIAPRGSIVTMLLRGLCSDLFIHGLGGGKYDQFVDAFAQEYWGTPLPRFVVTSATRHLFPEAVERYTRARGLRARYKEIISHTERFFGQGTFTHDEESALRTMVEQRRELLKQLQSTTTSDERSKVSHALNDINKSVRSLIDASSLAPQLAEGAIDDARLARWSYREFPFFFFQESLRTS